MGRTSDAKEKLLQVALQAIWEQSYGSVSVDEICEKARVKKGSFYHFFPSKCELAVAAYDEYWRRCEPRFDELFAPGVPPLRRIEDYCWMIVRAQQRRHEQTGRVLGCPIASVGSEMSTQNERVRQKTAEVIDRTCSYLEQALQDAAEQGLVLGRDPLRVAQTVNGLIMGLLLQARIKNDCGSLSRLPSAVMQLLGVKEVERISAGKNELPEPSESAGVAT